MNKEELWERMSSPTYQACHNCIHYVETSSIGCENPDLITGVHACNRVGEGCKSAVNGNYKNDKSPDLWKWNRIR